MDSFGYALGVILTDGSAFYTQDVTKHTHKSGEIGVYPKTLGIIVLQCRERVFADRFAGALNELTGRAVKPTVLTRNMGKSTLPGLSDGYVFHGFQVRVKAKAVTARLIAAKARVMAGDLDFPESTLAAVVVGVVDGDGHVRDTGGVDIAQKDPAWICRLLDRVGIAYSVYDSPSQRVRHVLIPGGTAAMIPTLKNRH